MYVFLSLFLSANANAAKSRRNNVASSAPPPPPGKGPAQYPSQSGAQLGFKKKATATET